MHVQYQLKLKKKWKNTFNIKFYTTDNAGHSDNYPVKDVPLSSVPDFTMNAKFAFLKFWSNLLWIYEKPANTWQRHLTFAKAVWELSSISRSPASICFSLTTASQLASSPLQKQHRSLTAASTQQRLQSVSLDECAEISSQLIISSLML